MSVIYLAARYSRRKEMQDYAESLLEDGHIVTSRWLAGCAFSDYVGNCTNPAVCALDDLRDLDAATTLISFTEAPGGDEPGRARGGRHVEFGYMLARANDPRRPIDLLVVGPRENCFHSLAMVRQFDTFDAAREWLRPRPRRRTIAEAAAGTVGV